MRELADEAYRIASGNDIALRAGHRRRKWADVGRFKGPVLRALAARAPYFHNGSAATLEEAIEFYEGRFNIGLTPREKVDLAAFCGRRERRVQKDPPYSSSDVTAPIQ